jgi:TRAP-type mannitol/chloroaromatic compound transport system permease small subunit
MQKENVVEPYAPETYAKGEEPVQLKLSDRLRRIVDFVGRWGSWFIVPLVLVTVLDVVARKLTFRTAEGHAWGMQIWLKENVSRYFESTLLQELEWHLHTALFALVLGFGTVYNTHVRVDLIRDHVSFRKKTWIEFLGLTCFMIPYLLLVIYFASSWVVDSYKLGEISASTVGLSHRWIIKSVLVFGLIVATIAGVAVWLQVATLLWGRNIKRFKLMTLDWPEDVARVEGKERIILEDTSGMQAPPVVGNSTPAPAAGAQAAIKPAE